MAAVCHLEFQGSRNGFFEMVVSAVRQETRALNCFFGKKIAFCVKSSQVK